MRRYPQILNPQSDDYQNEYMELMGSYRGGREDRYHSVRKPSKVIFEYESDAPNPGVHALSGALTPDKGILGTIGSRSHQQGKTKLQVFGDAATGEVQSWTLWEWVGTGKNYPDTDAERYGWKRVPNAGAAQNKYGFAEGTWKFLKRRRHSEGEG